MTVWNRMAALCLALALCIVLAPQALAAGETEIPVDPEHWGQAFAELFEDTHMVLMTEDFIGAVLVEDGADYTFQLQDPDPEFDYTVYADMDGESVPVISSGNGSYTIRNVTGSLVIGARKTPKPPQASASAGSTGSTAAAPGAQTSGPAVQAPVQTAPQPSQQPVQNEMEDPAQPPVTEPAEELVPEAEEQPPVTEAVPQKTPEAAPEVQLAAAEPEPFPWWIFALVLLGAAAVMGLILLLNRKTVAFAVEGGDAVRTQKILKGRMAARPPEPRKDGAVFAGWFRDEDRTQRWDFENTKVTNHMTLYAKWLATG